MLIWLRLQLAVGARYGGAHGGRDNSREVTQCLNKEETRFGPHPEASSDLLPVARVHFPRVPGTLRTEAPAGDHDSGGWGVGEVGEWPVSKHRGVLVLLLQQHAKTSLPA